ncbi:MAG: hypothetical protein ABI543_09135 [Ignavibacteria bacterium]
MPKKENKSKFSEDTIKDILKLVSHGVKYNEIESILRIEKGSIEMLSRKSVEFKTEMEIASLKLDIQVEEALLKRSLGYVTTEEQWIYIPVFTEGCDEPELKLKEIRKVKKFIPPDASSDLIWLYNRRGERWSKNPNVSSSESYEDYAKEKQKALKEAKENL